MSVQITVRGVTKWFAGSLLYHNLDLCIAKGKITCIFGPNGCGKSTLLNILAGLTPTDAGKILFDNKPLCETSIGYVFQNYREAMFPWLRAIDNIKYPLKIAGLSRIQCEERVEELVNLFGVKIDLGRYPYELSGGQQQLVSIIRALATYPNVLFLDEPFSALDYETTLSIREKLQEIFKVSRVTMVMVSHDLEEAVYMADRIVLLSKRPTQVAEEIAFDAPRPRTTETLSEREFIKVKARCLEVFQKEVRRF